MLPNAPVCWLIWILYYYLQYKRNVVLNQELCCVEYMSPHKSVCGITCDLNQLQLAAESQGPLGPGWIAADNQNNYK